MQIKDFSVDQNLKEMTEHRTTVLPVACYVTTISENINGHIPLHWHEEFQFIHVIKGITHFQINEELLFIQEGEGLFINSGRLHLAKDHKSSGCVYICLNVSPNFVVSHELYTTFVSPYIQATNLPYLHLLPRESWADSILTSIGKIEQLLSQSQPFYEIEVSMELTSIWKNIVKNGIKLNFKEGEALKDQRMKKMLNWIHQHYTEKILLEDIAQAGHLSRSECCRYFKRFLNKSPLNYVTDYRIQKSLLLLQHSDLNVTDVAYQVGFNSTSYFIDKFRKSMNMTPFAYKKYRK